MSLSQTQIQNLTDKLAAVLLASKTGGDNTLVGATTQALRDQLGAAGIDLTAEDALGPGARAIDQMFLPANYAANLQALLTRAAIGDFVAALNAYARSGPGGGYADLGACLAGVGAKVHPFVAEAVRARLGEGLFGAAPATVFAPPYACQAPAKVYLGTASGAAGTPTALADKTSQAASATTGDLSLLQASGDEILIGATAPFRTVVIALSTPADITVAPAVSYWNGTAWAAVAGLLDFSAGLTKNQPVQFTLPADWIPSHVDSLGCLLGDLTPLYYLKITAAATANTPPVGTCINLVPSATLNGNSRHYGTAQPPLLLCRITAANVLTNLAGAVIDLTRFAPPLGSENALRLRALTPIAQNLTVTLAYTKGDGTTSATNAQSSWTAPAALGVKTVALASGNADTLAAAGTGSTVATTAIDGVFAVELTALRTPAL